MLPPETIGDEISAFQSRAGCQSLGSLRQVRLCQLSAASAHAALEVLTQWSFHTDKEWNHFQVFWSNYWFSRAFGKEWEFPEYEVGHIKKKTIKDQEVKTFEASFSLQWVTCSTSFKINRKEIDFIKAKFLLHTFMTCFSSASLTSRH